MKAVIEIMESKTKPLYFVTVTIPKKNTEDGPEVHAFYCDTHLSIQIPLDYKPIVKYVGEPGYDNLDDLIFGESDMEDFMKSIEYTGSRTS